MCVDDESRPPIRPIAGASVDGEDRVLESADGTRFGAYLSRAAQPTGAGILVLPDIRGLHPFYVELADRFAELGLDALAVDWYGRTAGVGRHGPDFDPEPHIPLLRYESLLADARAAAADLRTAGGGRADRLFAIGFCLGGRLGFLATTEGLDLAGVVGFYGRPVGPIVWGSPVPIDVLDRAATPFLGIFAGADEYIPVAGVEQFRDALAARWPDPDHRVLIYPGTRHSFFDILADQYAEASADAWRETLAFLERQGALGDRRPTSGSGRSS